MIILSALFISLDARRLARKEQSASEQLPEASQTQQPAEIPAAAVAGTPEGGEESL